MSPTNGKWKVREWWDARAGAWRVQLRAPVASGVTHEDFQQYAAVLAALAGYTVRHGEWHAPWEGNPLIDEYEATYSQPEVNRL